MSKEPKVIHCRAESWAIGEQPKAKRRPSLKRQIAAAERAGKAVTSVTLADGTKLNFGETTAATAANEWDEVCRGKH